MPKFAANITLLFDELPYLDRFDAAAEAGFGAVEILFPYDWPGQETLQALLKNRLDLVLINAPPPNYTGGEPGFAAIPGNEARFEKDIARVMRYVDLLKPRFVHVMSGKAQGAEAEATFIRNLQWAADKYPDQQFTIEPLNPDDQPGYFLNRYDLAARVLDAADRRNLGLQYDAYHAQKIHGDALAIWREYGGRAAHIQIGDTPDRRAPLSGEIDFKALFQMIDDSGYAGWVSGEYHPRGRTEETLQWMR
ncbi:hydroxypyruvate isomerase family protein [Aestuariivita boseongensis]|uniref:hydroxypyruvate isomerase family protein n=1 Tax=Aestuariivita boseongensis TaxID=1470562 RepID=UPI0006816236|nr:TIM barrel protein [Aestuariivita boseongensis]